MNRLTSSLDRPQAETASLPMLPMRRYVTREERVQRAIRKAQENSQKAWRLGPDLYRVHSGSRRDMWHQVRVLSVLGGLHLSCECEAGAAGQPCWHAAKVWLRLDREAQRAAFRGLPESDYELFEGDEVDGGDAVSQPSSPNRPSSPSRRQRPLHSLDDMRVVCEQCGCILDGQATYCVHCDAAYSETPVLERDSEWWQAVLQVA